MFRTEAHDRHCYHDCNTLTWFSFCGPAAGILSALGVRPRPELMIMGISLASLETTRLEEILAGPETQSAACTGQNKQMQWLFRNTAAIDVVVVV